MHLRASRPRPRLCFAVGDYSTPSRSVPEEGPLIERWNGSTWSLVASPAAPTHNVNALLDVHCVSTTNCFAVGDSGVETGFPGSGPGVHMLVQHWDGSAWSTMNVTSPDGTNYDTLHTVTCTAAAACMAVGQLPGVQTCTPTTCTQPLYTLAERYA